MARLLSPLTMLHEPETHSFPDDSGGVHTGSENLPASRESDFIASATSQRLSIQSLKIGTFIGFSVCHLLAALAFVPWLFSWAGVASFVAGLYFFGILG